MHPKEHYLCFGHEEARHTWIQGWKWRQKTQAWLFTGPQGVGKRTLALNLARVVLGNLDNFAQLQENSDAAWLSQISTGSFPYLMVIGEKEDEQGVEAVRKIGLFLGHKAPPDQWRCIIIDNADVMTVQAHNALLKLVEEPAPQTVLFILACSKGKIPATLRSRCQELSLRPLSLREFREGWIHLSALMGRKEEENLEALYQLSKGCLGQAVNLISQGSEKQSTILKEMNQQGLEHLTGDKWMAWSRDLPQEAWTILLQEWFSLIAKKIAQERLHPLRLVKLWKTWDDTLSLLERQEKFHLDSSMVSLTVARYIDRCNKLIENQTDS